MFLRCPDLDGLIRHHHSKVKPKLSNMHEEGKRGEELGGDHDVGRRKGAYI